MLWIASLRGRVIRCSTRSVPSRSTRRSMPTYLWRATRARRAAIKLALMDNRVVIGVGNIYANEALFRAGIRPTTPREPPVEGRASRGSSTRCATCWRPPSPKAAARCATTSAPTARPAISSSTISSMVARATPAASAAPDQASAHWAALDVLLPALPARDTRSRCTVSATARQEPTARGAIDLRRPVTGDAPRMDAVERRRAACECR